MALFICHWGAHFLSTICYIFILPKTDLEPVTLGDYTWKGFTAKSLDTPIAILWTGEEGSEQIQLMICLENGDKISLEDADVQAIIASINISK